MFALFTELYPLHRLLLRRSLRGTRWVAFLGFLFTMPISGGIFIAAQLGILHGNADEMDSILLCAVLSLVVADVAMTGLKARYRTLYFPGEYQIFPIQRYKRFVLSFGLLALDCRGLLYAIPWLAHVALILVQGGVCLALVVCFFYLTMYGVLTLLVLAAVITLRRYAGASIVYSSMTLLCIFAMVMLTAFPERTRFLRILPIVSSLQGGLLATLQRDADEVLSMTARAIFWTSGIAIITNRTYAYIRKIRRHPPMRPPRMD